MLADPAPGRSPRITSHVAAQEFIRAWVMDYCRKRIGYPEPTVSFRQKGPTCTFKIMSPQDSAQGKVAANTLFSYDLAQGVTEGMLKNMCLAAVEPIEAWQEQDSKWKGKINV